MGTHGRIFKEVLTLRDHGSVFEYEASKGSRVAEAPALLAEGSVPLSHWEWGEEARLEAAGA